MLMRFVRVNPRVSLEFAQAQGMEGNVWATMPDTRILV